MIWSDIGIYKRDYTNGIKKIDDLNDATKNQNDKLKHNQHSFNTTPQIDEYGLNDKYTIRPFKLHYDQSFKDLFKNRTTPSSLLKGRTVNLSTGTKEIIKMTNKMIPKIDYSGLDPGYYEHNLNEVKSNKDLMMRQYSKATEFAKEFVKTKKEELASKLKLKTPENIAIGEGGGSEDFIDLEPAPSHHPSRSTEHNKRLLTGLNISPIKKSDGSLLESEFLQDLDDIEGEFNNLTKAQDNKKHFNKNAQTIQNAYRVKKAKKTLSALKEEAKRKEPISNNVIDFLEDSDS